MKSVLFVDDDVPFTSSIARMAHASAPDLLFTVTHTADGALGVLSDAFDCLVVDLRLGRTLDGFRVLDARRARRLRMPAIVVSGHFDAKTAPAVQRLEAAVLPKENFVFDDLAEMIRNPPLAAFPSQASVVELLEQQRFTYAQAKALPMDLVERVYIRKRSVTGTADALHTTRQLIQDVLKRQLPRRT